jgi:putative hemolysin
MLIDIVIVMILIALSAFFSCVETAFMVISRIKAETLAKQKIHGAETLLKLKQSPRAFIITVLIGNNIVNTAAAALGTVLATSYFGSTGIGIATGIMSFLILTVGEIIPKSYSTIHAEKIMLPLAAPIMLVIRILSPLVLLFELMTRYALKIMGSAKKSDLFSEAELRTLVEVGVKEKHLDQSEKELIEGVLAFKQTQVKDVMTPKRRMFCLDQDMFISDALHEINKREHSRIPVYQGTKENITGVVYLKDLLSIVAEQRLVLRMRDIAKKPMFVDEGIQISAVFKQMKWRHVHIAFVINKKREVKGLITLEDIIEEIVGDIFDEKDISPTLMKKIHKTLIIAHGDTEINDINSFFNIRLPNQAKTLHGFLETIKRRELQEGLRLKYNDLLFTIREVKGGKPVTVFIEKK